MRSYLVKYLITMSFLTLFFGGCDDEKKASSPPTVTTDAITAITDSSAMSGGNVINAGSSEVIERGCVGIQFNTHYYQTIKILRPVVLDHF